METCHEQLVMSTGWPCLWFLNHYHRTITAFHMPDKTSKYYQTYLFGVPYLRTIIRPHKTRTSRLYGKKLSPGETALVLRNVRQDLCHQHEDTRNEVAAELSYINIDWLSYHLSTIMYSTLTMNLQQALTNLYLEERILKIWQVRMLLWRLTRVGESDWKWWDEHDYVNVEQHLC